MIFLLMVLNIFALNISAAVLTIKDSTWFKTKTSQSSKLNKTEKCLLPKESVFKVRILDQIQGHTLVEFLEKIQGCPFQKGYLFSQHISVKGNQSDSHRILIPYYFYQWFNRNLPGSTCGMTSAAMLLSYHLNRKITPDEIFRKYGSHRLGQSPEGLARIYRDYGIRSSFTRFGSFDQIKKLIQNGEPVVVHGYFTAGHIVLITGFNQRGFITQDPAGEWAGFNYGGYPRAPNDPTGGKNVVYTYEQMRRAIIEPSDGSLWASWAIKN